MRAIRFPALPYSEPSKSSRTRELLPRLELNLSGAGGKFMAGSCPDPPGGTKPGHCQGMVLSKEV